MAQSKETLTIFIDTELKKRLKDVADFEDTGVSQIAEEWLFAQYAAYIEELNNWIFDRDSETKYETNNMKYVQITENDPTGLPAGEYLVLSTNEDSYIAPEVQALLEEGAA